MSLNVHDRPGVDHPCDTPDCDQVVNWRFERLTAAGFEAEQAATIAANHTFDLHALLALIDRGCPPPLAARIVAPIDVDEDGR